MTLETTFMAVSSRCVARKLLYRTHFTLTYWRRSGSFICSRWHTGKIFYLIYPHSSSLAVLTRLLTRNLKITLSVGGWTYSQNGHFSFVTDATKRQTFVNSALQLIEDYGLDGLDLDFEYPSNAAQGQGFADLITALRSAFDSYAAKKGDSTPYSLTVRRYLTQFVIPREAKLY